MKTKEEIYNDATLKELGENPNGTRMDIIYRAMDEYAEQMLRSCGILTGDDAERFLDNMNNHIKVSPEERELIMQNYEAIKSKAKF